jgi:hypothetical protein
MSTKFSRRSLIAAITGLAAVPLAVRAQYELTPEVVPAPSPQATPPATSGQFHGSPRALWDEPWEVEGKWIRFKCIIIQRLMADKGEAIRVGSVGDFRSLLRVEIPAAGTLWVATDLDLEAIKSRKTVEVEGQYGGLFGPGWIEPVVIAKKLSPA